MLARRKTAFNSKPKDHGFWKKGQEHVSRCIHYMIYKCLMQHRAKCKCMLLLVMAGDCLEFQHSENSNQADSHAEHCSKRLKYNTIREVGSSSGAFAAGRCGLCRA
jgi:hypothetical protein